MMRVSIPKPPDHALVFPTDPCYKCHGDIILAEMLIDPVSAETAPAQAKKVEPSHEQISAD